MNAGGIYPLNLYTDYLDKNVPTGYKTGDIFF